MAILIGVINKKVIEKLCLKDVIPGTPIFVGEKNLEHMQNTHPEVYLNHGSNISDIISEPDYIGFKDNSIEYVKEFISDNMYIKVAVKISGVGTFFARTMFELNSEKVARFIKKGFLIKY